VSEAFEKYLAGQPINEELAALKNGRPDPLPEEHKVLERVEAATTRWEDHKLTDADRQDLRELRQHPGWTVFVRLTKRAMAIHQKTAIVVSKSAPLANADKIAQEWGAVWAFERACGELTNLVEAELLELAQNEEGTKKQ
jgi:hypothetical protein